MYEQTASLEGACAAKWMYEFGVGREVGIDRICLFLRRALDQLMNHVWRIADWIVHRLGYLQTCMTLCSVVD